MDRQSELELVARVRAGDADAFTAIHVHFNTRLFRFLARLAQGRDVAEDLLEETWLRFVDRGPKLRPDTRLAPFLFTIARNLYVSYCRSRALEYSHAASLIGLWPGGSTGPSPFESAAVGEIERRLEAAIADLPSIYREALLLVVVDGMRTAEAAQVCGIAPDALRQRVSRARAMIAKRLELVKSIPLNALKEATS